MLHISSFRGDRDIGSAFCVHAGGLFITTARALENANGSPIKLILFPNEPQQHIYVAEVVRTDSKLNLALLQVSPTEELTAIKVADDHAVPVGSEVITFNHTLRSDYHSNPPFPTASLRRTHIIASMPRRVGEDRLSCDAMLDYFGSGSPVLDSTSTAIGMIEHVVMGSNHHADFIPARYLRQFLAAPVLSVSPGSIAVKDRFTPQEITVHLLSIVAPPKDGEVEFSLAAKGEPPQVVSSPISGQTCTFRLIPCRAGPGQILNVSGQFSGGLLKGRITNHEIKVADQPIQLSEVRQIDFGRSDNESSVRLNTGQVRHGRIEGLAAINLDLGETTVPVDLGRARTIEIDTGDFTAKSLAYTATYREARGPALAKVSGDIAMTSPDANQENRLAVAAVHSNHETSGTPAASTRPARDAAVVGDQFHTMLAGGLGGRRMEIISPQRQDVIGFRYELAIWDHHGIIRTLEPLFDRPANPQGHDVIAKEGYVVGGLLVDSDLYAHAFRIIFMRLKGNAPDPTDSYTTDWIGTPSSGAEPKKLAGNGQHVIGVYGRKGLNMDAVGLVVQP